MSNYLLTTTRKTAYCYISRGFRHSATCPEADGNVARGAQLRAQRHVL